MTNTAAPAPDHPLVHVSESIPAPGASGLSAAQVASEKIPSPPHLFLDRELARGAMGHVHPATDRNLLRRVALKRIDKDYATHPFYRDGFIAEAQITGQLEHPNIVPVHELAIDADGIAYFTMKLVQGHSFDRWLKRRPPGSMDRIAGGIEILLKVCDALAYAHHRGVVHRDLKPANLFVTKGADGRAFVKDLVFGTLEFADESDALIGPLLEGWTIERLPTIDRIVLRMGVFELRHRAQTPPPVVINEAVELAKKFSTEDSGRFVNGVLSRAARGA